MIHTLGGDDTDTNIPLVLYLLSVLAMVNLPTVLPTMREILLFESDNIFFPVLAMLLISSSRGGSGDLLRNFCYQYCVNPAPHSRSPLLRDPCLFTPGLRCL